MRANTVQRWALGAIGVFMLPTALHATIAPRSWFDDFPIGRGWIAAEGTTYDEHLVRDVGVLFVSLIIVTAWSVWKRSAMPAVAVAWLVQGTLHFVYHASHVGDLHGISSVDKIALVGSLGTTPVLAAVALWAGRNVTMPTQRR